MRAAVEVFPNCDSCLGFEINPYHVQVARSVPGARVYCENFFGMDWPKTLDMLSEPILVIGNPPWVTNSALGALSGTNLPNKSNFQGLKGFDAVTGKSNFDISEWMLIHLLSWLSGRSAILAMLCKTAVARKVLQYAWQNQLQVKESSVYGIDSAEHFRASVKACLLICVLEPGSISYQCSSYLDLDAPKADSVFAFRKGKLVADLEAMHAYGHLCGTSPLKWRSGVKHDCSRVMELYSRGGNEFKNGLGEIVTLESIFLYPMLKSSELMKPQLRPSRYMLVTQETVGQDTSWIRDLAPRTWSYLEAHAALLDRRSSIIYRKRPRFSIFGVGEYTFSPWKVAISGFYKRLNFRCVGSLDGKPLVLDDTCYFLPCKTEKDARVLAGILNSTTAKSYFRSFVFWDSKRPITAQLLASLDLGALASELGVVLPSYIGGIDNLAQSKLFVGVEKT